MKIQQIEESLKEKLWTLNTAQLIRFMVVGLRKRHTEISMSTFGHIQNDICYGCAATNAILELLGIEADVYISETKEYVEAAHKILAALEYFYDDLRHGKSYYLQVGSSLENLNFRIGEKDHFKPVKYPKRLEVPNLTSHYTEEHLQAYENLANCQ